MEMLLRTHLCAPPGSRLSVRGGLCSGSAPAREIVTLYSEQFIFADFLTSVIFRLRLSKFVHLYTQTSEFAHSQPGPLVDSTPCLAPETLGTLSSRNLKFLN